jgi:hypothetical protein
MRVPGGFFLQETLLVAMLRASPWEMDKILTAIRIFSHEESDRIVLFYVGLTYAISGVKLKFVNHCIEELVLTSASICPKRLCNKPGPVVNSADLREVQRCQIFRPEYDQPQGVAPTRKRS